MKWEYKTITYNKRTFLRSAIDSEDLNGKFNRLGEMGWELVSLNKNTFGSWGGVMAVFKRSKKG